MINLSHLLATFYESLAFNFSKHVRYDLIFWVFSSHDFHLLKLEWFLESLLLIWTSCVWRCPHCQEGLQDRDFSILWKEARTITLIGGLRYSYYWVSPYIISLCLLVFILNHSTDLITFYYWSPLQYLVHVCSISISSPWLCSQSTL